VHAGLIQADEIWTFCLKKQARVVEGDPADAGDQYVFVGIDALSKLTISYRVGRRDAANARAFACDLRFRVIGAPQVSTDGFVAYRDALEWAFGSRVSHGVATKIYQDPEDGGPEHRYAPGRVIGVERERVSGNPVEEAISTSYVERQNLTMRMHMRRFTRLSNGFSRKLAHLEAAVALHFAYVNWCRVHETTRVTPAQAASLSDRVWSVGELLTAALAEPETPDDPAPDAPPAPPATPPPAPRPVASIAGRVVGPFRVIDGGRQ
jgi:IS1 family transposase